MAVKVVTPEGIERDIRSVFEEAGALDSIQHPAIIRLRECDFADPGRTRPYLVMEYFDGQTLEGIVRDAGPVSSDKVVPIFLPIAEALHAAHGRGVLHRDIKPANLLVKPGASPWEPWQVKIIDFGLALKQTLLADAGTTTRQGRTMMGASIAGTIDYAAPEQMGKFPGVRIGPAADVYGFGRTCCYALFRTPNPLRAHWRQVPDELADILEGCLHEDPHERVPGFGPIVERLKQLHGAPEAVQSVPVRKSATTAPSQSRILALGLYLGFLADSSGDPDGCCRIVACAVRLELTNIHLNENVRRQLMTLLGQPRVVADPVHRSWEMRRGLEQLLGAQSGQDLLNVPMGPHSPLRAVQIYLELAIQLGAPAYDAGDWLGCYEVYAAVARIMLKNHTDVPNSCASLNAALQKCEHQRNDASAQAWTMRYAFDAILSQGSDEDLLENDIAGMQGYNPMAALAVPRRAPGFSRPISAILATLYLGLVWVVSLAFYTPTNTSAKASDKPVDKATTAIGLVIAALCVSVCVGVPGGLLIRSYRSWLVLLAFSLGVPVGLEILRELVGVTDIGDRTSNFLALVGVMIIVFYAVALPLKLLVWLVRRSRRAVA